jgi:uncharacterized membrane protein
MLVMFVIPGKKLYRHAKYDTTESFSDIRHNLVAEKNLKKQIAMVTSIARFKQVSQLLELLDNLKVNFLISNYLIANFIIEF